MDLTPDFLTLIGTLMLMRPAWRVDMLMRESSRLETMNFEDKALQSLKKKTTRQLQAAAQSWDRMDSYCLRAGFGALALAALWRVSVNVLS